MNKIVKKSNQKRLKYQKQHGFGIVSVILGIVASAIIVLLGFQQYQHAMMKIKIGSAQTQFQDISTGIDSLYATSHDFSNISTQVVINAGIASKDDVVGSTIVSPWYSSDPTAVVTITPSSQPTSYTVDMAGVPKDACSGVGSMFLNNAKSNMTINGTAVTDPASMSNACASADSADISINF
jgi:Tfp pilus assembly protein PilE